MLLLMFTNKDFISGRLFGADDFLPMLTYVLAQCDMPQLDNDILYMMELLDPSLLNGEGEFDKSSLTLALLEMFGFFTIQSCEHCTSLWSYPGGYYLTSAYGAMSLIRNFQEEQAARVLSSETRDTLHQWHRRRTAQRSAPSIDDFQVTHTKEISKWEIENVQFTLCHIFSLTAPQNYLRVALQELDSGCTAKTLQVRPYATVEEVCQICAQKFKVSDPENYGLYLVMEGSSQQLAPDTHPQKIKAELHSRPQAAPFHFVFRRMPNSNMPTSAPFSTTPNLNDLTVTPDPQANLNDLSKDLSIPSSQASLSLDISPALRLSLPANQLNGNSISVWLWLQLWLSVCESLTTMLKVFSWGENCCAVPVSTKPDFSIWTTRVSINIPSLQLSVQQRKIRRVSIFFYFLGFRIADDSSAIHRKHNSDVEHKSVKSTKRTRSVHNPPLMQSLQRQVQGQLLLSFKYAEVNVISEDVRLIFVRVYLGRKCN